MFTEAMFFIIIIVTSAFVVSYRMSMWDRAIHIVSYLAGILLLILAVSVSLGHPKQAEWELVNRGVDKVRILAATYKQDVAIYVWIKLEGQDAPLYYALPWSDKAAEQLQKEMRERGRQGKPVEIEGLFNHKDGEEYEFTFYETPIVADDDKQQAPQAPIIME